MALTDEQIAQERKAFEAVHPMPGSCMWVGRGYAGTEYNAWWAHEYAAWFKGWIERAEATASLLERIAALEAQVERCRKETESLVAAACTPLIAKIVDMEAEKPAQPVSQSAHGWITDWPKGSGGTSPVYTPGANKPSYGSELNAALNCYPLYTSPPKAAPLTDEQCDAIASGLDDWAREVDHYEFGLPIHDDDAANTWRAIIRSATGEKGETP